MRLLITVAKNGFVLSAEGDDSQILVAHDIPMFILLITQWANEHFPRNEA